MNFDINVYGDISERLWENQASLISQKIFTFHYKKHSQFAKWNVFVGNAGLNFPVKKNMQSILVLVEPPDIFTYSLDFLKKFTYILGPNFKQYNKLENYQVTNCLVPWHLGVNFGEPKKQIISRVIAHLPKKVRKLTIQSPIIEQDLKTILNTKKKKEHKISVITSSKIDTPNQKLRISFIKYLIDKKDLPLEVYGRGINPITNKYLALKNSSHHIALENSVHDDYWTEKFADSLLSENFTFYHGAPNINDYFSKEVVRSLDLTNFEKSHELIVRSFYEEEINYNQISHEQKKLIQKFSFEAAITSFISKHENQL